MDTNAELIKQELELEESSVIIKTEDECKDISRLDIKPEIYLDIEENHSNILPSVTVKKEVNEDHDCDELDGNIRKLKEEFTLSEEDKIKIEEVMLKSESNDGDTESGSHWECNLDLPTTSYHKSQTKYVLAKVDNDTIKMYSCSYCGYRTQLMKDLNYHIKSSHNNAIKELICDHCDYITDHRTKLNNHVLAKHDENTIKKYSCDHSTHHECFISGGCCQRERERVPPKLLHYPTHIILIKSNMNAVQYILKNRPLPYEDKLTVKALGRPTPELDLKRTTTGKTRNFNRYFKRENYDKFSWMCGCTEVRKLFCFICLLSNDLKPSPWISEGVSDLQHLQERASKHAKSISHLHHLVDYNVLGKTDIRKQLDSAYVFNIRAHNEKVDKNRHILRRLIMCVKCCDSFELALRGHDEGADSENQVMINFASELDSTLSDHLKEATVFKETSKTIQNELLDAMLQVCRSEILEQITKSNFVALEAEETTDSFNQQQLVIVFRYVFETELFERFWCFIQPTGYRAQHLADAIMKELESISIPVNKLIAQSYDGTSVMSGKNTSVQSIIRQKYPGAYYIHGYAHQFNLLLEKAASCNEKLKIFFAEIQSFASFFSRSAKRTAVLDEIAKKRLPRAVPTRWNFETRTINTLYEKKDLIHECLEKFLDTEKDAKTLSEVNELLRIMRSTDFNYFIEGLHYITRQVDIFFIQVQSRQANSVYIQTCLKQFESQIIEIRERRIGSLRQKTADSSNTSSSKRPRMADILENSRVVLQEYCDELLNQIKDRYDFTGHLSAASLFLPDLINTYKEHFPEDSFMSTVEAYPLIDKEKLKTELTVIYGRADMRCAGALPLLAFINKNNLQEGFSETYKLLDILCTTPMTTAECEGCFSTLKRIKCFLRNTISQERLNALAMLSIEKKLVQSIADFDNKVISVFASNKNRRMDFNYI